MARNYGKPGGGRDPDKYIEELAALYAEEKRDQLLAEFGDGPYGASGSPIERLMAAAFAYVAVSPDHFGSYYGRLLISQFNMEVHGIKPGEADNPSTQHSRGYEVWAQERVGKYTADFIVRYRHWRTRAVVWAIVECDGHNYHERTEKQARHDKEQDRFFQEKGFAVLRFTGAQITRDPVKAVLEALSSMERIAESRG